MSAEPPRSDEEAHGGCLCGDVRFRVRGPLRPIAYCHCSQCRRQTGLYYAATSASRSDVTIEGDRSLSWYAASADAERGFCSRCGSALFWRAHGSETVSILAGSFDEGAALHADRHIYVGDKPDWYGIGDDLKQFKGSD